MVKIMFLDLTQDTMRSVSNKYDIFVMLIIIYSSIKHKVILRPVVTDVFSLSITVTRGAVMTAKNICMKKILPRIFLKYFHQLNRQNLSLYRNWSQVQIFT